MTWARVGVCAVLGVGYGAGCAEVARDPSQADGASFGSGGAPASSGAGAGAASSCAGLTPVACTEYCEDSPAHPDCAAITSSYDSDLCGVPLKSPPGALDLQRSSNVAEFAGSGPAALSCCGDDSPPGTPAAVTMKGVAKLFSHGCESKSLSIAVYTVKRTGGADDGAPDELVGPAVATPSTCDEINALATPESDCGTRYECYYEYPGVPTETELLVITDDVSGSEKDRWWPVYEYNVYVGNDDVGPDGAFEHDVPALAHDDYIVMAQVAIGGPIDSGRGCVIGEVHDCEDVRLVNAVVDVDVPKVVATYFSSDEEHPLPKLDEQATGALGLYGVLELTPGAVTVAAAGRIDGVMHSVGFFHARVYPDAMTFLTFRGRRPFQGP